MEYFLSGRRPNDKYRTYLKDNPMRSQETMEANGGVRYTGVFH